MDKIKIEETINQIKKLTEPIFKKYKVDRAYIFGSYARGDFTIIKHMLKYCEEIKQTIYRFGNDINKFKNDNDYKDSLSMKIFQIGELANHLTDEYLEETKNEMNWNAIRGMRNRFAHWYGKMDLNKIFYNH